MPAVRTAVATPQHAGELAEISARSLIDPWPEHVFRRELERGRTRALVAVGNDGGAIGYALGWRILLEAELLSFAVHPEGRRRGIGRGLLCAYLQWLRGEGVRSMTLEVRASNRVAQRLYGSVGMLRSGERRRYYRDGETALLFEADLTADPG